MAQDEEEKQGEGFFSSFMGHLEELRKRIVNCVLIVGAAFLLCYHFSGRIFAFIAAPIVKSLPPGSELTMIELTEAFMVEMKVSLLAAVVVASPFLFYQIWKFIAPALHQNERKYVWQFVFAATFFFLLGASFCYLLVLPWGYEFFLSYATPQSPMPGVPITARISLQSALSLAIHFTLAMGAVFELPVIVYFLARMGVVTHRTLSKARGPAVVVIFIIAAILTPPDVMSQTMMAVPLIILYELSIVIARIFGPKVEPESEG